MDWTKAPAMDASDALTMERRARLAAERLAEARRNELFQSARKLTEQAKTLAEQVIERREENMRVKGDLVEANTRLQTAERRLWLSLEAMRDGFAVFDSRDRLVTANAAWFRVFDGLAEVAPGISYGACVELAVNEGIVDLQGLGGEDWISAIMDRWRSGRRDPVILRLWSGAYVRLTDTRTEGGDVICHAQNITRSMRREERLREAHSRAEAASRAKSAFLATMSHELRTPMNGVLGMTQLLEDTPLSDEQKELIGTIKSSSEALLRIINDVLDFSKAEAGKLQLTVAPFDLEEIVLDVFQLLQPLVAEKPVALLFDIDMALPVKVKGDAGRMRQVLMNLVGNAIKFTDRGHVMVRLIGLEEDEATRFVLTVEDTGIGIPSDKLDHIFGEFNQVDGATNRRYEGTGLGLAITRRLITLMGGEVWVSSEEGEGSCFGITICMPRSDDSIAPPQGQPGIGKTIALSFANGAVHEILSQQLQHFGCVIADTPEVPPDAVLCDLATSEHLQGQAPVYQLSASPRQEEAAQGQAGQLPFPLNRTRLHDFIASLPGPEVTIAEETPIELRKLRILAADDNRTNRMVVEMMVRPLRVDLKLAEDGQQAVQLWQDFKPDLIFMDISMPIVDGREAARQIRAAEAESGRHTPIFALTAHSIDEGEHDLVTKDFDGWLPKPLKKDELLARITEVLPAECLPVTPT
jgi:signal transduction histidine kinase/CheY-like chemotaxis protein